jgi:hypothetical protein
VAPALDRPQARFEGGGGGNWVTALVLLGAGALVSGGSVGLATGGGWW